MGLWKSIQKIGVAAGILWSGFGAHAIDLDITKPDSIVAASQLAKENMLAYYNGYLPGNIPGYLMDGYYWWEAGAMMGVLIHNWKLTGNTSLEGMISQALQFQVGDNKDYQPRNWSAQLGNDDQVFWAFSVMDAAEQGFPNPPNDTDLSWLGLAQAVFNDQAKVWDNKTCNGGLRWQIPPVNPGYNYKNVASTGGFFQLAARLARYTGNETYATWANTAFDWLLGTPIITQKGDQWTILDGADVGNNCSQPSPYLWTYNPGNLLMGAAYLYNWTSSMNNTSEATKWQQRINILINSTDVYFVQNAGANPNSVMPTQGGQILTEVTCETTANPTCNKDEPAFKGFLARWMAITTQLAPWTAPVIFPKLQASAKAAAAICTGQINPGHNQIPGTVCGRRWYQNGWDGQNGPGEQMSALSVFQNLLIPSAPGPFSASTGGNSQSQPGAGGNGPADPRIPNEPVYTNPVTTGDKAGAAILTILGALLPLGGASWMVWRDGVGFRDR